jgi:hypothetical protein
MCHIQSQLGLCISKALNLLLLLLLPCPQALQFLVFENKGDLSLQDLTDHLCPSLNHQQLYRLCTTAWSSSPEEGGWGSNTVFQQQM